MDINNNNLDEINASSSETPAKSSGPKKLAMVIIAILILIGIFYGASYLSNKEGDKPKFNLENVNNLEKDDKVQALKDQLEKYKDEAAALNADAGVSAKTTIYSRLADIQIRLEQYNDAIATLDKIPEERKTSSTVEVLYARSYYGLKDNVKAKEFITKALASEDDVPDYWLLYFDLSQDMESNALNALYFEALSKTDNNIDILSDFAKSLEKRGDKAGAISIWQKAIEVDAAHKADYEAEITRLKQ